MALDPWDLELLLDNAPDIVAAFDGDRRFVHVSGAVRALTGRRPEELMGKTLEELGLPGRQAPALKAAMARVVEGGAPEDVEIDLETPAGRRPFMAHLIHGAVGVIARLRDISDAHAARMQAFLAGASGLLSASVGREATLVRLAQLAVPTMADWVIVHVLGPPDAQGVRAVTTAALEHNDPAKSAEAWEMSRRYPVQRTTQNGVYRVLNGGGAELYADVPDEMLARAAHDAAHLVYLRSAGYRSAMVVPLIGRSGAIGALTFVAAESGRRYTKDDLAIAEDLARRAALAVESADLLVAEQRLRQDAEDAVLRIERLQRLTGALAAAPTPADCTRALVTEGRAALAADAGFVWLVSEDGAHLDLAASDGYAGPDLEAFRRFPVGAALPVCDALKSGRPLFFESAQAMSSRYPHVGDRAAAGFKSWAAIPFLVPGRALGALSLSFAEARAFTPDDKALIVSMATQASSSIERTRLFEAAQQANRAKDEFLAMLGHELRNPLSPILTALQLMRTRLGDKAEKERAVIERQVAHLVRLVDDLLDVSRITRAKLDLKRRPVELAEVVALALEMASPLVEERRHRLDVRVPASGLRVDGDIDRLAQAVANVVSNAAKYTEPGGRVEIEGAQDGDDLVLLRVRDSGIGIAPELLPRIFDLFVQGDRTLDRSQGGLGLGLAIVRGLVHLHGGTVTATSAGGRGTELVIRLPVAHAVPDRAPPTHPGRPRVTARRILVVDDNVDAAEILAEALADSGHATRAAFDGPSALKLAAAFQPEVALLDIGLPVMDGFELARKMREIAGLERVKLLAVTGYGQDGDKERVKAAGFDAHVIKPVELDGIEDLLERVFL